SVGAGEADLVSFEEREGQVLEERPGPVALADRIAAQEERAVHRGYFFFFGFFFSFRMPMPLATCSPPSTARMVDAGHHGACVSGNQTIRRSPDLGHPRIRLVSCRERVALAGKREDSRSCWPCEVRLTR